jgi:hypothetical protein
MSFFLYMMWQIVIGGVKGGFYAPSEGKLFPLVKVYTLKLAHREIFKAF